MAHQHNDMTRQYIRHLLKFLLRKVHVYITNIWKIESEVKFLFEPTVFVELRT